MKALPLEQKQLLELQKLDLQIAKLHHEEQSHPALQTLAALRHRQADLRGVIVAHQADLQANDRQSQQVEDETTKVRDRRNLQEQRLNDGKVPMRDMSAMEHEIGRMEVRIQDLEGDSLELMEAHDKLEEIIAAAEKSSAAIGLDEQAAQSELGSDALVSQSKLAELSIDRDALVEKLPVPLVREYVQTQKRLGTQVVIEVRDGQALRSPVEFSMAELARIASVPADQLYISDETEYLVVRTSAQ